MGLKEDFKIIPLKSKYPMGAEKTLIGIILDREVPIGGLPLDVGVVVHNVSTAKAIHDAIFEGKPFVERVVTVTGAVKNPKNLLVRLGTPLRSLIESLGDVKCFIVDADRIIYRSSGLSEYLVGYLEPPTEKGIPPILIGLLAALATGLLLWLSLLIERRAWERG
ncbi:unnamed protein product [marine sediment metagenome]|uniref:Soluble ligand binding domain-containing protein n=1 Tax=marine sediment metagenome TaxID=412755 RepID=X1LDX3_9ZZZZ